MAEIKCPCGLRGHMEEDDCRKTLCCECCPLQKDGTRMAEYIEREALQADIRDSYQKLHEIYNGLKFENERAICGAELTTFCEILMRIKDWPAADVVEVRCGRWEDVRENVSILCGTGFPMTTTAETCTACRFRSCFVGPKSLLHDNICPNCGARMDGE